MEINPIERIGVPARIAQIQNRIASIQNQFVETEKNLSADKISADFQTKLDAEISRQEKIQETKDAAATEKNSSDLSANKKDAVNVTDFVAALTSGNVATPNILSTSSIEKIFEELKAPSPNDAPDKDSNFEQSRDSSTEDLINLSARRNGVSPELVRAVAIAESDMNQNEISPVGAIGVMQLMPETAAALGVNPYDKAQNIEGGTIYLRQMLDKFNGNVQHALAAYNAGPGAVQKYGGVPPYSETQNYVGRIMDIISG